MSLDKALGIIAGLVHLSAFVIYNKQMLKGQSIPNSTTWTLWAFLTGLNCITYFSASGDWVKALISFVSFAACLGTFLFALYKGKLNPMDSLERVLLLSGVVAAIVWFVYRSASKANLVLQLSLIISFVAIYRSVWKYPRSEKALPWFVWSMAFVINIAVVIWRWQDQWIDLAYPVNCMILHLVVALLTYRKPKIYILK